MRIYDGTSYRDATPEEEAEIIDSMSVETAPSADERIAALEEQLVAAKILLGVE